MSDALVTIAQFHGSNDASVAKKAMDSAGIESAVENDIRLEVHNEDAYRAYHVLDTELPTLPTIEEPYEAPKDLICASCGSGAVLSTRRGAVFGSVATLAIAVGYATGLTDVTFFLVGAAGLFLLMSDRWRCTECGESWN
jgi:hypothetical protein